MKFWALLALATSVAAIPLQGPAGRLHKRDEARKHIGYRSVTKGEAEAIHANGGKAVQSNGRGTKQLSRGLYMTAGFQEYNAERLPNDQGDPLWDCVVTVDADFWNSLKKAWIPRFFEFPEDKEKDPTKCHLKPLWSNRWPDNRPNFLKYLDPDSTPDNTVLFAKIASHEAINQALIPPPIIDEGEIYLAQCAERGTDANEQLGQMGYADWDLENLPGWGLGADAK